MNDELLSQEYATSTWTERLGREGASLVDVFVGAHALTLLSLIALVWFIVFLVVRFLRRGSRPRLGSKGVLIAQGLGVLVTGALTAKRLVDAAPLVGTVILAAGGVGFAFGLALRTKAWVLGLMSILREQVKRGDRLTLEGHRGLLVGIEVFRLKLRAESGEEIHLPLSALADRPYAVASPKKTYPVELQVYRDKPIDPVERQRIFRAVALCPYRELAGELSVKSVPEDNRRLLVRLTSWSPAAARRAEEHLRRTLL